MRIEGRDIQSTDRLEDERLAAYTDQLLSGLPSEDRPPLADAVDILARTLSWQEVPAGVRIRLRQRLAVEWERQHRRRPWGVPVWRPWRRLLWVAAGLTLVGALAVLILSPTARTELSATSVGTAGGKVLLALGVAALLLLIVFLLRRR
ncbi:MAG TPA: hypothetical protein G4O00_03450 [Thermoflexia bacterium]|nr:hypothetical protein [Thermoflexia bacterium]